MKKNHMIRAVILLVVTVVAVGCADIDKQYSAEKLYWKADQQARKLLTQTGGTLSDKDYESIIAAYRVVVDRFPLVPKAADAEFTIAAMYMRWGKPEEAKNELKQVIQNFSVKPSIAASAQFQIGKIFEYENDDESALRAYEKIIDLYPLTQTGITTPLYVISFYQSRGDNKEADKAYRRAVRHYEGLVSDFSGTSAVGMYYSYLVRAHMQAGKWDDAIKVWDEMITLYPDSDVAVRALLAQAETYATKLNNTKKAISLYKDILAHYPNSQLLRVTKYKLATLYLASQNFAEAEKVFTELLGENVQDDIGYRSHLGVITCAKQRGETARVLALYDAVETHYADDPRVLSIPLLRYNYFVQLGKTGEADRVLEETKARYENLLQRYMAEKNEKMLLATSSSLFLVYVEAKEWDKAIALLQQMEKRYPNDARLPLSIATVYSQQLNQPQEALNIYQDMLKRFAANPSLVAMIKKQMDTLQQSINQEPGASREDVVDVNDVGF